MANPFGYGPQRNSNLGQNRQRLMGQIPPTSPTLQPSDVLDAMARQPLPYVPTREMAAQQRAYDELLRMQRYRPTDSAVQLFGYGQNA